MKVYEISFDTAQSIVLFVAIFMAYFLGMMTVKYHEWEEKDFEESLDNDEEEWYNDYRN